MEAQRLAHNLFLLPGAVNTGVLVAGESALLFDCCDRVTPARLQALGVKRVERILCTQHRRTNVAGGTPTSTQALVEDPRLAGDGYHLGPGSPAVDVALNVGIVSDVDGDRRPIGQGSDVGADERSLTALLPLVLRGQG